MKSIEFYKERTEEATREGFSHAKGSKNWAELLNGLKQEEKYNKMAALMQIIKELAPDMISKRILDMLPQEDPSRLPFNPDKLEFKGKVGRGGEHKVFLLESTSGDVPSYVLKINHQNLGSLEQIQKKAVEFKEEYEGIRERYASMPGLVPEELTIIMSNLKTGKPIMATIQRFYGGNIRDLLNDFKREKLVELLEKESQLFGEFQRFYHITEKEYDEKGIAVDLLGDKNLSIIETDDGYKLVVLDPHSSVPKIKGDNRTKRQEAYMRELKQILDEVIAYEV